MARPQPIRAMWNGEALIPQGKSVAHCRDEFGEGEIVMLERNEERSINSHNHFFASLHEAWMNLPEAIADEFPTVEHLRAKALVETGYCSHRQILCRTDIDAIALAALIEESNAYAVVRVRSNAVDVWTAKSQSRKSMNKREFQESKDKVLEFVAALVDVTPKQLERAAR